MTFYTITNSIKNKIENIQKADQKKNLKIKDITLIPEFEKLLTMDDSVINAMTESMKTEGFKPGHELHIWAQDGKYILIDGHTRRHCAIKAGLTSVPCIIHHFDTLEEAKKFAIREQTDRRNLSGETLLQAVANFNFEKGKGNSGDEKGKASEIIGKQLGVSSKTVEKARVVLKEATEEQKEAIRKEELSVNQVYNQLRGKDSTEKTRDNQPKLTAKEKSFIDGIHYAITQINSGISLKELYHQTNESFNYSKMIASLKEVNLSKLFAVPEDSPAPEEA
ncbi:MAG: ParB N-terminal domain-containing protein [Treponemataceae bacterium]|nr:ParB N-terminal domain-containing protein [Treponemataceae bacterium]